MQALAGGFTCVFSSDDRTSGDTHDFSINLSPPIDLTGADRWQVALCDLSTWYTWFNISDEYNNRIFRYSHNGGATWTDINITPGIYSADNLIDFIEAAITANGHVPASLRITPNESIQKFLFQFTNNYRVDFTNLNIRILFGAESQIYSVSGFMPNVAQMTNGVNTWYLQSDLLESGYQGRFPGRVLHSFNPGQDNPPGSALREIPNTFYNMVRSTPNLSSVRFHLTDQRNRALNINGEPLTVRLHFQPLRKQ